MWGGGELARPLLTIQPIDNWFHAVDNASGLQDVGACERDNTVDWGGNNMASSAYTEHQGAGFSRSSRGVLLRKRHVIRHFGA